MISGCKMREGQLTPLNVQHDAVWRGLMLVTVIQPPEKKEKEN